MSSEPHTIHCLRATHFAVRTGSSVTSKDFTSEFVAWFQMYTFPEYRLARIQGSVGCSSTPFTRSERCTSLRLMSRRRGIAADRGTRKSRRRCVEEEGSADLEVSASNFERARISGGRATDLRTERASRSAHGGVRHERVATTRSRIELRARDGRLCAPFRLDTGRLKLRTRR